MIEQQQPLDQLPKEIKPAFRELNVLKQFNIYVRLYVSVKPSPPSKFNPRMRK
jgi:hypothetical protein